MIEGQSIARSVARRAKRAGDDVTVVSSLEQLRAGEGSYDHGIFGFEIAGRSGIVLAASLLTDGTIASVEFVHPEAEAAAPRATRPASTALQDVA